MSTTTNPYLAKIALLVGETDAARAVQAFVELRRTRSVSLEDFARELGVSEIIEERLPFEGGIFRLSRGRLVIKLNTFSSDVRKRFTLAHEIGHLLLGTVPGFRTTCQKGSALERACDCIAAELLMPSRETATIVQEAGTPSPEKLRSLAGWFGVSLHTAALRVHKDLRLWSSFVGLWDAGPRNRTLWFVGRPNWESHRPDSYSVNLALCSEYSVRTKETWQRGSVMDEVHLHLLHIGKGRILGLVNAAR